ncbi:DUF5684 domain-containing protein [Chitinophaga sp. HK235]|uniref:DUF5684 domain-containing protein n=1 Tax=Chitinophaga sp. HK235 TaxID=2952571 RepID=UPI001BA91005|nr:DUF5684 domain-containing protein [Chitinophaga sp. HK235]
MDNAANGAIFALMLPFLLFSLAFGVFYIICNWKIYKKAGFEGWECIVPIYSAIIMLRIIGKPWWWLLLFMIPGVNVVFAIWATNLLSKSFGKEVGFTLGLIFLGFIFVPILAFDRSIVYHGPAGDPNGIRPLEDVNAIGTNAA